MAGNPSTSQKSNQPNVDFGPQVELSGFADLDTGLLLMLKKISDNHVRKMSKRVPGFTKIKLVLKKIHHATGAPRHDLLELKGAAEVGAKVFHAEHTDRDLFIAVNKILHKLEEELGVRD